jgi:hypothetical protein
MSEQSKPMLERIARAVAIASDPETEARARGGDEPYILDSHRKIAKAALEAMRGELPKEMLWAGANWQDHCTDVDTIFDEMIKGALWPEEQSPHRLYLD